MKVPPAIPPPVPADVMDALPAPRRTSQRPPLSLAPQLASFFASPAKFEEPIRGVAMVPVPIPTLKKIHLRELECREEPKLMDEKAQHVHAVDVTVLSRTSTAMRREYTTTATNLLQQ